MGDFLIFQVKVKARSIKSCGLVPNSPWGCGIEVFLGDVDVKKRMKF